MTMRRDSMMSKRSRELVSLALLWNSVGLISLLGFHAVTAEEDCARDENPRMLPDTCRIVLAEVPSTEDASSSWGVFSLVARKRGTPVDRFGDLVIPIVDNTELLKGYAWDGGETGSHFEGRKSVRSVVPGLGMLANVVNDKPNLLPLAPRVDEGGLTRFDSPGAGATTHYHNYTFYILQDVEAGEELLWSSSLREGSTMTDMSTRSARKITSLEDLKQTGYCLDNMKPGKSRIKEAGRGAFATRGLSEGMVVAPVPVLPIQRSEIEPDANLLTNYCLGNKNSSTLLFPYGPMVNLINHYTEPNVRFQWRDGDNLPTSLGAKTPLFMELVATRDIEEGEELYLEYGRDWEDAWWRHVKQWEPADSHYTPSYVMDDVIRLLRTEKELKEHPYPENLFTSCFYRYSDRSDDEKAHQPESSDHITTFQWKLTKRLFDLRNLRPCQVLKRNEDAKGRSAYAVRMLNRPGLPSEERIPKDELHIVTHVPRNAVRFSDKAGTTDMHLPHAFRREIGLPVFPEAWMDLLEEDA